MKGINSLDGWQLNVSRGRYVTYCLVVTLGVRLILSVFKALAIGTGEHLENGEKRKDEGGFPYRLGLVLWGWSGHKNVRDYWLAGVIGFAEAAVHPILTGPRRFCRYWWLASNKTAGQWRGWEQSRTAFNRFSVGNPLVLAFSYSWLTQYVDPVTRTATQHWPTTSSAGSRCEFGNGGVG